VSLSCGMDPEREKLAKREIIHRYEGQVRFWKAKKWQTVACAESEEKAATCMVEAFVHRPYHRGRVVEYLICSQRVLWEVERGEKLPARRWKNR
jgi:hypothetical protein